METKRPSRAWTPDTEFTVEETGDGVLRPTGRFPEAVIDEVVGSLGYKRKSKTAAHMRTGVRCEVMRRHESGRY